MTFDRTRARRNLRNAVRVLRLKGPKFAGKVARIEAALEVDPCWPFDDERYREFCREIEVPA